MSANMDDETRNLVNALSYDSPEAREPTLSGKLLGKLFWLNDDEKAIITTSSGLGNLDVLPRELLFMILERTTLSDLLNFRRSGKPAMFLVDSMPKFRKVVHHGGLDALRGVVAIQTTAEITLPILYEKLIQQHCDNCARPAQYIWLVTCRRICLRCPHPDGYRYPLTPLGAEEIMDIYGLQREDLASIPSYQFLPAVFTKIFPKGRTRLVVNAPHTLYDANTAAEISFNRSGLWNATEPRSTNSLQLWEELRSWENALNRNYDADRLIIADSQPPWRYRWRMALVFAPWLSPESNDIVPGFLCAGCSYTNGQDDVYNRQVPRAPQNLPRKALSS